MTMMMVPNFASAELAISLVSQKLDLRIKIQKEGKETKFTLKVQIDELREKRQTNQNKLDLS